MAEIYEVCRCHGLNLISSAPTAVRSHNVSLTIMVLKLAALDSVAKVDN